MSISRCVQSVDWWCKLCMEYRKGRGIISHNTYNWIVAACINLEKKKAPLVVVYFFYILHLPLEKITRWSALYFWKKKSLGTLNIWLFFLLMGEVTLWLAIRKSGVQGPTLSSHSLALKQLWVAVILFTPGVLHHGWTCSLTSTFYQYTSNGRSTDWSVQRQKWCEHCIDLSWWGKLSRRARLSIYYLLSFLLSPGPVLWVKTERMRFLPWR